MSRDLRNSLPLDESLWFDCPALRELAGTLVRPIYKRVPRTAVEQTIVLLTNLHYCTRDDSCRVLAISMDHHDYAASKLPGRYNPVGLGKSLIKVVHALRVSGWIGHAPGFGQWKDSRVAFGHGSGHLTI